MSKVSLKYAEVHGHLFCGGTNLLTKLDPKQRHGLVLEYDKEHAELHVTYNNATRVLPSTSVFCYEEGTIEPRKAVLTEITMRAGLKAQVDSPQAHVHAGPGAGKSR